MGQIFLRNLYCRFFSEHLGHARLNPKKITWSNSNFHESLTIFKKRNFIRQIVFVILKLKKSYLVIWLVESIIVYNLRKIFSPKMRFLQNHKNNYGPASCKPENSTLMKQIFCQLQKALLSRIFQAFSQKHNFFLNLLEL